MDADDGPHTPLGDGGTGQVDDSATLETDRAAAAGPGTPALTQTARADQRAAAPAARGDLDEPERAVLGSPDAFRAQVGGYDDDDGGDDSFRVLEPQEHDLRAARALTDVRRAEAAARVRTAYLAGDPVQEGTSDALPVPARWRAVREFEHVRSLPLPALSRLMDGVPEVSGLPKLAEWHPVLDRAASSPAEEKLKATVRDGQVLTRRMLRILTACDALAEDDRLVVLLDTMVTAVVSFAAAQKEMVADFLLARARTAGPMPAAAYFDKVRALDRRGAPPTLGSSFAELSEWSEMLDHRLLAPAVSGPARSGASLAASRRARATSSRRTPSGAAMPARAGDGSPRGREGNARAHARTESPSSSGADAAARSAGSPRGRAYGSDRRRGGPARN